MQEISLDCKQVIDLYVTIWDKLKVIGKEVARRLGNSESKLGETTKMNQLDNLAFQVVQHFNSLKFLNQLKIFLILAFLIVHLLFQLYFMINLNQLVNIAFQVVQHFNPLKFLNQLKKSS
jgi:magnesium-transporting ATPase (P-type)